MSVPQPALFFDNIGGYNAQHMDTLAQDRSLVELVRAQNVIPDPLGDIVTREGFSYVRASQISGTPAITGMFHNLRSISDRFVLTASNGEIFEDDANPPVAKAGGTDFTSSADNLTRADVHESLLIIVSRQRDLPQTINSSGTKADLGGTPPRGLDYKVFGRRGFMFSPSVAGTIHYEKVSYNSANDDHDAWTDPVTVNFINFGRQGSGVEVVGGEVYADHLMVFTQDRIFPVYTTPNATQPFGFQKEIFSESGGGPVGAHSIIAANESLYWISRNFDVKKMTGFVVRSIGYKVQPFLRGLSNSRRDYIVAGWEPKYRMIWWAVSDGSDTQHQDILALQVDTENYYLFTIQVNSLATRLVSGEQRLIGGHYNGRFSNMFDGSNTGDLQDENGVIDADVQFPKLHLGQPGFVKKIPHYAFEIDPISSEIITVQANYDDNTDWTGINTTKTASGTDYQTHFIKTPRPYSRIQPRFRNNTSGARFRLHRIGFPRPKASRVTIA